MIELRWFNKEHYHAVSDGPYDTARAETISKRVLQIRQIKWRVDASGAVNVFPAPIEWTEWEDVPEVFI
jgi:hypothetical protein